MKKNPVDMDMSKDRTFVYHKTEAPDGMMVYSDAVQGYYDEGWVDTKAKFGEEEIDESTDLGTIDPGKIDDASDLSDYLNEKYGMSTNHRQGLKKLKTILKRAQNDNSSEDN